MINQDKILDNIYDSIDSLFRQGKLNECNSLLESLDISTLSVDEMLGYLTATLPARTKLSCRRNFYRNIEAEIIRREMYEAGLLDGLA
jgi:hypothetical protein